MSHIHQNLQNEPSLSAQTQLNATVHQLLTNTPSQCVKSLISQQESNTTDHQDHRTWADEAHSHFPVVDQDPRRRRLLLQWRSCQQDLDWTKQHISPSTSQYVIWKFLSTHLQQVYKYHEWQLRLPRAFTFQNFSLLAWQVRHGYCNSSPDSNIKQISLDATRSNQNVCLCCKSTIHVITYQQLFIYNVIISVSTHLSRSWSWTSPVQHRFSLVS